MNRVWLQSYSPGVPETIDLSVYQSLLDPLEKYSKQYAELPAFSNLGVKLTYRDMDRLSLQFAAFLQQKLGLKKGERVAIMLPNLLQYPVAMFAALRAGLVVVNVNPLYTASELEHQLNDADVSAIIVLANFAHVLADALPKLNVKHVVVTEIGDLLGGLKGGLVNFVVKYIKRMVPAWSIPSTITFKEALKIGGTLSYKRVELLADDIAFLQYTGGTTGVSKGAVLTHRNMMANVMQCVAWVKPAINSGNEIILGALPLYHIFSLTVCCLTFLALGSECVLVTNPRDLKGLIKLLQKTPISIFVGLNTLFNGLINHPDIAKADFSKLKLTVAGGMATQKSVAEEWHVLTGVSILEGYGLTEASPVVSINPITLKQFNGSIGLPVPSTDVAIRADNGHSLPFGEVGELCLKGPQVMREYWQHPEETDKVFDKEGWLRTGDMARMDEKGFLYLVDRKKDMIDVSGFNVYPIEVEQVITMHPGVNEAAVIGIPSEKTGEAVKAFVVKKDHALTEEALIAYCRESLTSYKVPKQVEFCDDLPKTNVGKVLRRHLREGVKE